MVGRDLHLSAAVGQQNVRDTAEDFGLPVDWLNSPREATAALPAETLAKLPAATSPAALVARSQHLECQVSGWHLPPSGLLLRQAVQAQLSFTPALAK